jgi:hypothetical protein
VQLGATVSTANNFSNTGSITIPGSGTSGPAYANPSTISVSGILGTVKGVKLNLVGLSHQFPDGINVLLVGPKGKRCLSWVTPVAILRSSGSGEFDV